MEAETLAGPLENGEIRQRARSIRTNRCPTRATTPEKLEEWRHEAMAQTNYLQDELRWIRRSSAFDAR